jgi:hypothetical protein
VHIYADTSFTIHVRALLFWRGRAISAIPGISDIDIADLIFNMLALRGWSPFWETLRAR